MNTRPKKHPCPDCHHCQWCSDDRCRLCRKSCAKHKLSIAEQIARYEEFNASKAATVVAEPTGLPRPKSPYPSDVTATRQSSEDQ